jgi:TonB family protein
MESNMTRTIVAILALSSGMLYAQAPSPAQLSSTPVLTASIVQPVAVAAENRNVTTSTPVRRSTGVTPPQLIHSVDLDSVHNNLARNMAQGQTMVIDMTVDKAGKPEDLHVQKSIDEFTDQGVIEAVSQYRFKPGTLNGSPISVPVVLHYVIE